MKLLIFVIIVLATSVTLFLMVSKDGKNPSMSLKEGNLEINDWIPERTAVLISVTLVVMASKDGKNPVMVSQDGNKEMKD